MASNCAQRAEPLILVKKAVFENLDCAGAVLITAKQQGSRRRQPSIAAGKLDLHSAVSIESQVPRRKNALCHLNSVCQRARRQIAVSENL